MEEEEEKKKKKNAFHCVLLQVLHNFCLPWIMDVSSGYVVSEYV